MKPRLRKTIRCEYRVSTVAVVLTVVITVLALTIASPVSAQTYSLLTNGNFETGNLNGWTYNNTRNTGSTNPTGTVGGFFVDTPGTTTPAVGPNNTVFNTAANASGGNFYAVTSSDYAGQSALSQNFVVPDVANLRITLTFQMFVNDQSGFGGIVNASGLDYTTGGTFDANQHARVDILSSSSPVFTTMPYDVVRNVYLGADTTVAAPGANPFTTYTVDITSSVARGQSYRLRFAEVDNLSALNLGFDNVSIIAVAMPEPGTAHFFTAFAAVSTFVLYRKRILNL